MNPDHTPTRPSLASTRAIALALLVVASAVALPASAAAAGPSEGTASTLDAIEVDACTTIERPGKYVLVGSIENADADPCIRIAGDDVVLDGNGHAIDGVDGGEGSVGVLVDANETLTNVTVRDVAVTGWDDGVRFESVERGTIEGVEARSNGGAGIALTAGASNTVRNNTVRGGASGIALEGTSDTYIRNTTIRGAEQGIALRGSSDNTFRNNTVRNAAVGIDLDAASDNTFRNTTFRDSGDWAVRAAPSDGESSARNTFENPDLGFSNGSVSFTLRDAAVAPLSERMAPSPPVDRTDIGVYLNVTNTSANGYLDLTVNYDASVESAIDESTMALWRHNGTWSDRSSTLDTGTNTLTKNVTEFSVFAPLAVNRTVADDPVGIDGTNSPVVEGETMRVNATLRNDGDSSVTKTAELTIGGEVRDSVEVRLDAGEERTVELTWTPPMEGEDGNYTVTVATGDGEASTTVRVLDYQNFTVEVVGTNSPVVAGEDLAVEVLVGNPYDIPGNKTVTLSVGMTVRNNTVRTAVELDGGENETVTLTWETATGDAGEYEATVASPNDTDTRNFVLADAHLSDGGTYWQGQVLATDGFEPGAVVELRRGDGTLVAELVADADGVVTVRTATHDAGGYVLEGSGRTIEYELAEQDLDVSPSEVTVTENGTPAANATIEFASNRASFPVEVTSPSWSGEELAALFTDLPAEARVTEDGLLLPGTVDQTLTADFSGVDTGRYVITFAVADTTASDTVNVTVEGENDPPTVSVAQDTTEPGVGEAVAFSADASDPDGEVASYEWRVDGEVVGSGPRLTHYFDEAGEYVLSVTVTDGEGATATASRTVVVVNDPPTVEIGQEPGDPGPGETVEFHADAEDPDGNITTYVWTVDGEVVSESRSMTHTFEEAGDHEVRLRVTDDDGASTTATRTVTVNAPPEVDFSYDPGEPATGEPVEFSADASDPDGEVASYEWQVDGEVVSTGPTLTHTFEEPGEHEVTLVVTDDDGATATASRTVRVRSSVPSTATATGTESEELPGFGPPVAVVALAVAVLWFGRRQ